MIVQNPRSEEKLEPGNLKTVPVQSLLKLYYYQVTGNIELVGVAAISGQALGLPGPPTPPLLQ